MVLVKVFLPLLFCWTFMFKSNNDRMEILDRHKYDAGTSIASAEIYLGKFLFYTHTKSLLNNNVMVRANDSERISKLENLRSRCYYLCLFLLVLWLITIFQLLTYISKYNKIIGFVREIRMENQKLILKNSMQECQISKQTGLAENKILESKKLMEENISISRQLQKMIQYNFALEKISESRSAKIMELNRNVNIRKLQINQLNSIITHKDIKPVESLKRMELLLDDPSLNMADRDKLRFYIKNCMIEIEEVYEKLNQATFEVS